MEATMPVLFVPHLIGIPVLIGGGYFIIKAFQVMGFKPPQRPNAKAPTKIDYLTSSIAD
jgi:hypothetical protein